MRDVSADIVYILRDFMAAHGIMRRVSELYRSGELRFDDLHAFVGDDDGSVLFRLKERCHTLFRPRDAESAMSSRAEALFDLAVGSLFHEAMKFRENLYQQEIYGPRVRALRNGPTEEADTLFREFEKILASVSDRLEEGLQETEILTDQALAQLRLLLVQNARNGFVARFLVENRARIDEVFGCTLEALFDGIEGSAAAGFELAGRSYLESGFYRHAERALGEAIDGGASGSDLERLACYASGMAAYLAGDYAECLLRLGEWFEDAGENPTNLVEIARAAVSKIDQLAEGEDRERVGADAARLVERIGAATPPA